MRRAWLFLIGVSALLGGTILQLPGPAWGGYHLVTAVAPVIVAIMVLISGAVLSTRARYFVAAATLLFAVAVVYGLSSNDGTSWITGPLALAILILSVLMPSLIQSETNARTLASRGLLGTTIVVVFFPITLMLIIAVSTKFMDVDTSAIFGPFTISGSLVGIAALSFKTIQK